MSAGGDGDAGDGGGGAVSAEAVAEGASVLASDVAVGDVLRSRDGTEFTVSRIEEFPLFGPPLLAFIEDTDVRWFKMPAARDAEVTRVRAA